MAGRKQRATPMPRCSAVLTDGSKCRTWAAEDGLCPFHLEQRDQPEPQPIQVVETVELELPPAAEEALKLAPGQVRARLASDLADGYPQMVKALREAMGSDKVNHVTCKSCGHSTPVFGPDYRTRLDAAKTWTELGLGKAATATEVKAPDLSDLDVSKMTHDERQELLAEIVKRRPDLAKRNPPTQE